MNIHNWITIDASNTDNICFECGIYRTKTYDRIIPDVPSEGIGVLV